MPNPKSENYEGIFFVRTRRILTIVTPPIVPPPRIPTPPPIVEITEEEAKRRARETPRTTVAIRAVIQLQGRDDKRTPTP